MQTSQTSVNPKFTSARKSGIQNEGYPGPIAHVHAPRVSAPSGPGPIKRGDLDWV